MKNYLSKEDAVVDMHQRGYSCDFHLSGNNLLWIEEKILVRAGEFSIVEYHQFRNLKEDSNTIVFGIVALYHNVKGILLSSFSNYAKQAPPIIVKKINELTHH